MKINLGGLDPPMRENVYKGLIFPLPDPVVRFAFEARM